MTSFRISAPVPVIEPSSSIRVESAGIRATAPGTARRFEDALEVSAGVLLDGVEAASSFVPGGGVVSAAVRGARSTSAGTASSVAVGSGSPAGGIVRTGAQSAMMQDNMAFLELQQQMQSENRQFTMLSNVLKARHETAKNSINNIR